MELQLQPYVVELPALHEINYIGRLYFPENGTYIHMTSLSQMMFFYYMSGTFKVLHAAGDKLHGVAFFQMSEILTAHFILHTA